MAMTLKPPEVLLAKSPKTAKVRYEETLAGHSEAVMASFGALFGTSANPTRLAERWFNFFGIVESQPFIVSGLASCAVHDIGKANGGFQKAVRGKPDAQVIYHEHLSGLLLWLPAIRCCLAAQPHLQIETLLAAVTGHHLRSCWENFAEPVNPDRKSFEVYPVAVAETINAVFAELGRPSLSPTAIPQVWSLDGYGHHFDPGAITFDVKNALKSFERRMRDDEEARRLVMAVRAATILADSAGSGLVREGHVIEDWIRAAFAGEPLLDGVAIDEKVVRPRIAHLKTSAGKFHWHSFQEAAEQLPSRSLMLASCGSGKTLAAWRWIKGQAERRPVSRVIFLYPTRGTATEGFRDYVSWAPESDAALVHGTSSFDLDGMFEDLGDGRSTKDFTTEDRLYALSYWNRRIFSATVDQFLGFMQHVYRSTCLLPLLADSIIVIDEVHSFDNNLFSALREFLTTFDVPVLCMTASLPTKRRQILEECGLKLFPSDLKQFDDLQKQAEMPRYMAQGLKGAAEAREVALSSVRSGLRVLWVVNTVAHCQEAAKEADAFCYHSRFKLEDRRERHREVIKAFQPSEQSVMAVTTQVCEMSLDLDADVLISEVAPVTSLIQRMGRCNRHSRAGEGKLGQVYLYNREGHSPYSKDELQGSEAFAEAMKHQKVLSQSDLQDLLDRHGPAQREVQRYTAFTKSGPWAMAREETLREDHDFTVPAILDHEVDKYMLLKGQGKPTEGLVVPVPRRFAQADDRLGYLHLAPSSHYDRRYGFLERPVEVHE